jgi:hypothetical protein
VDTESIGIGIAIPSYDVKRVVEVMVGVNIVLFFDVK